MKNCIDDKLNSEFTLFRNCPVCESICTKKIFSMNFYNNKEISLSSKFDVLYCDKCGLIYQNSENTLKEYEQYYSLLETYNTSPTIIEETRELYKKYKELFSRILNKNMRILDIGCAGGELLKELCADGYKNLMGIDPSLECVNSMKNFGIDSEGGSIYEKVKPNLKNKFDAVILSGTLEHLYDINTALLNLREYLKEDGYLFISVPDFERYNEYNNSISYYFNLEHINHFSRITLSNLLYKNGYELIETQQYTFEFGSSNIPVLAGIYKKSVNFLSNFKKDEKGLFLVNEMGKKYVSILRQQNKIIQTVYDSKEEIVIWGTGQYAMQVMEETNLLKCRIKAFVDNDESKIGNKIIEFTVFSPQYLYDYEGTILILAGIYDLEIKNQINEMGINNKILSLNLFHED